MLVDKQGVGLSWDGSYSHLKLLEERESTLERWQ